MGGLGGTRATGAWRSPGWTDRGGSKPKVPSMDDLFGGGKTSDGMAQIGSVPIQKASGASSGQITRASSPSRPNGGWGGSTNRTAPDPKMESAWNRTAGRADTLQAREGRRDPYLEEHMARYRQRVSSDPTDRAIGRATGAIRSSAAGLTEAQKARNAATGRTAGYGGADIADAAQAATARAAADISMGRERDLDALTVAGTNLFALPGQRELQQEALTNQAIGAMTSAAGQSGQLDLSRLGLNLQQQLGTDASRLGWYQAENQARLAEEESRRNAERDKMSMYLGLLQAYGGA